MSLSVHDVQLAHELDASWLIALWLAIHGGDPPPIEGQLVPGELQEAAALGAIEALTVALDAKTREAVHQAIAPQLRKSPLKTVDAKTEAARLKALGFRITEYADEHAHAHAHSHTKTTSKAAAEGDAFLRPPYCIHYKGMIICVELPKPVHSVGGP
jgi:hypothetical protein